MNRKVTQIKGNRFLIFLDTEKKRKVLPWCSGVYIISTILNNKRLFQYIGTTNNFNQRIYNHLILRIIRNTLQDGEIIQILFCKNGDERTFLEERFIHFFKPPLNKKPKYGYKPESYFANRDKIWQRLQNKILNPQPQ